MRWHHGRCADTVSRDVRAFGILDSYRREKGLEVPNEGNGNGNGTSRGAASATVAAPSSVQQSRESRLAEMLSLDSGDDLHYSEDDTPCPVDCVLEVYTAQELHDIVDHADGLVVVDFYKTACGACKYIAGGFAKICKASDSSDHPGVVFVKHNVYDDEEEELTGLAKEFNIKNVPMFRFFKGGREVESFATRDKARIAEAINRHSAPGTAVV